MSMLKSQRTHFTDPQFLTFRNNPLNNNQNTGRSIFSQQFNYKSLQKYQIAQSEEPTRNFRKKLKETRSQQKNLTRELLPGLKILQNYNQQNSNESSNNQLKNQILRKKLQRIDKKIKAEKRKQFNMDSQIKELQAQLYQDEKKLQDKLCNIQQLEYIYQQNVIQINKFEAKYQEQMNKNCQLERILEQKGQEVQGIGSLTSISSSSSINFRQKEKEKEKQKNIQKLINGVSKVQKLRDELSIRQQKMQLEINKMKNYLQSLREINISINITQSK